MRTPTIARRLLAPLLLASLVALFGCSTSTDRPFDGMDADPDRRLDLLLAHYRVNLDNGLGCLDLIGSGGHATVDCERIRRAVGMLANEFPHHRRILLANAILNYQAGRYERAQHDLDILLRLQRIAPRAVLLRSRIAMEQGNVNRARRLLASQVRLVPNDPGLREGLAAVHFLEGRYRKAEAELAAAQRLGAPEWRIDYLRGLLAEARGRWPEARNRYRRSLRDNQGFEPAYARLSGLERAAAGGRR